MTIRAAVMTEPERPLEMWDLKTPSLEPGGILLDTVASEVCGTDVHLHRGQLTGVPYPIIPGHVSVGRVAQASGVNRDFRGREITVGDLVTFYDVHEVCHSCWFCLVARQPNRCPNRKVYGITYSANDGPLGGWSEQIYLKPGVKVFRLSEHLDVEDFIGGGCGLFTGFAAVDRSGISLGDSVLVQGTGPVGLSAIGFARLAGADLVVAVGDPSARLQLAARFGSDRSWSLSETSSEERREAVLELTGGRGVDVAIEATGNPRAVEEGLGLVRDGGVYVVAGHYTDTGTATLNPHLDINRKHLDIRGQWGTGLEHMTRALSLLERYRERLPFGAVVGGRYSLADATRALDDVAQLRVTKAIVVPRAQ